MTDKPSSQPSTSTPEAAQRAQAHTLATVMRKLDLVRSIGNVILIVPLVIIVSIAAFVFIGGTDALVITLFLLGIGGLVVVMNMYGVRKLVGPMKTADKATPFKGTGAIDTQAKRLFPETSLVREEETYGWLGPVQAIDVARQNYSLSTEVLAAPENTLILTNHQLIGLTFVQSDFDGIDSGSLLSGMAQFATAARSASEQQRHLALLNRGKWPALMQDLSFSRIAALLGNHWQFGIPLIQITSMTLKTGMMNPGVHITLADGTTLKYTTTNKDLITSFGDAACRAGVHVS